MGVFLWKYGDDLCSSETAGIIRQKSDFIRIKTVCQRILQTMEYAFLNWPVNDHQRRHFLL
jgi:hypothetical protein